MPRPRSYHPDTLASDVMRQFWRRGFHATSIDDLVTATGVSRHGLYAQFVDKHGAFVAALERYVAEVVDPAFSVVEQPRAGLAQIGLYLDAQIGLAERTGLPGPGCLMANTLVESAPHDDRIRAAVARHFERLRSGFETALTHEAQRRGVSALPAAALARYLTIATQGLWSVSRISATADPLREFAHHLLRHTEGELAP